MLKMCQISSLMAATEGPVAEFSSFATLKKEKEIEPFDVISENSSLKGSFGQIRKNPLFRSCRLILDNFGLTLLKELPLED